MKLRFWHDRNDHPGHAVVGERPLWAWKMVVLTHFRFIHGEPTIDDFIAHHGDCVSSTDKWSEWLLRRRHGDDPNNKPAMLDSVGRIRDRLLEGAGLSPGMILIDVGSGDGLITFGAFERVGSSLKAILADISAPLLKHAEKIAIERGLRNQCTFIQTSAEQLDGVDDEFADVLTTRAVLAYVDDKAAAARQFHRVLKPGGRVSIAEPIHRDEAINLAALTDLLGGRPAEPGDAAARLWQRWRAAQLPSTLVEIQRNSLTNFCERDLLALFQNAGFAEMHLELHIDIGRMVALPWDTFIDSAPRPGVPTLRELFSSHFSEAEQHQLEEGLRAQVESGQLTERNTIAYLVAEKPKS